MTRKLAVGLGVVALLVLGAHPGGWGAPTQPSERKVGMCWEYVPGGWETVYVPVPAVDGLLRSGRYNEGECLPA